MSKCLSCLLALMAITSSLPAQMTDDGRFYPNPGIVANRNGSWVGSDHLYNLTDKIDIVVEIFKPESVDIPITNGMIRERVAEIFKNGGITPIAEVSEEGPPLPFFHVLVMIYPLDKGYVAFCEGRLFEKVNIDRIRLDEQTLLQGITWESQNLILSPKRELESQLNKSIEDLAETFVERYNFYENIRKQIKF